MASFIAREWGQGSFDYRLGLRAASVFERRCSPEALSRIPGGAVLAASMCALPLKTWLDVLFESRSRARGFLPSAESGVLGGRLEQEEEAALVLERHVQVRALMTHVDSCHMLRSALALWARNARFKAQLDDTAGLLHAKQALGWLG